MTNTFIISFCVLIIMAYIFDLTTSKTKIPSVILLLLLGWGLQQITDIFEITMPNLSGLLPILGTIGLIVIVLEGALELEFNKSKLPVLKKSLIVALIPMVVLGFLLAGAFYYYQVHFTGGTVDPDFRKALIGAIPLTVISSAIAIPSAVNLGKKNKEFVTYESSLSDILGVLFFDFMFRNATINFESVYMFLLQLILIALVSFFATVGLSYLLAKINHQIKFVPIIILVILIYTISKIYHLPALIFIMLFGMFLGNLEEIKRIKFIRRFKLKKLENEVTKFHEILAEGTFLVRVMFFLLFGFLINTEELLDLETFYWALGIVGLIFLIRFIQLKASGLPAMPLMFVAPRGLITILLFLYINPEDNIAIVNETLITQVILLTVIIMMFGLMSNKNVEKEDTFLSKIKERMSMASFDANRDLKTETVTKSSSEQKEAEAKKTKSEADHSQDEIIKTINEAKEVVTDKITSEISSNVKETDEEKDKKYNESDNEHFEDKNIDDKDNDEDSKDEKK
ncbi:cation:proton antiporter [Brumimicrobium aurantiacum]|uniref:sodium:proton antiporter n=1 Tax=Brumimicrobium aurantiacum TaxID=1737063 RepID=UPI00196B2FC4|nr:sodium:proton antiporter [Brumimicrobium aurantiacum]